MDYHDLKMLELEQIAEERMKNALVALRSGDIRAKREIERLAIMLDNIRQMKTAVTRMRLPATQGSALRHS